MNIPTYDDMLREFSMAMKHLCVLSGDVRKEDNTTWQESARGAAAKLREVADMLDARAETDGLVFPFPSFVIENIKEEAAQRSLKRRREMVRG